MEDLVNMLKVVHKTQKELKQAEEHHTEAVKEIGKVIRNEWELIKKFLVNNKELPKGYANFLRIRYTYKNGGLAGHITYYELKTMVIDQIQVFRKSIRVRMAWTHFHFPNGQCAHQTMAGYIFIPRKQFDRFTLKHFQVKYANESAVQVNSSWSDTSKSLLWEYESLCEKFKASDKDFKRYTALRDFYDNYYNKL